MLSVIVLALLQSDADACDFGARWPDGARCREQSFQRLVDRADELRRVTDITRESSFESRFPVFCETIHFESGAAESCDWEHVSIEKNRKEVACKRFSKGTSARCEQTDKDAPSPLMLALRDSTLERRKDHGIRMTALRSEGTGTTTWVFWTGAGALVTGGDACDEPVWLGEVTGFPSFGLRCVWGDGGALAVWKTTAVLHLVDLRKHGVARLGQHALVLGSGLADASRVIPTDTPPPNGSAPPPTFKLEGRRVLVSSGQAFCFSSGWKRC